MSCSTHPGTRAGSSVQGCLCLSLRVTGLQTKYITGIYETKSVVQKHQIYHRKKLQEQPLKEASVAIQHHPYSV